MPMRWLPVNECAMKNINFSLYTYNHYKKRWQLIFGLFMGTFVLGLISYTIIHVMHWQMITTKLACYQKQMVSLQKREQEMLDEQAAQTLQSKKIKKIEQRRHEAKNPCAFLLTALQVNGHLASLCACSVTKERVEMTFRTTTLQECDNILASMRRISYLSQVKLARIHTTRDDQQGGFITCVVQAQLQDKGVS
jgi:hypothetical protein